MYLDVDEIDPDLNVTQSAARDLFGQLGLHWPANAPMSWPCPGTHLKEFLQSPVTKSFRLTPGEHQVLVSMASRYGIAKSTLLAILLNALRPPIPDQKMKSFRAALHRLIANLTQLSSHHIFPEYCATLKMRAYRLRAIWPIEELSLPRPHSCEHETRTIFLKLRFTNADVLSIKNPKTPERVRNLLHKPILYQNCPIPESLDKDADDIFKIVNAYAHQLNLGNDIDVPRATLDQLNQILIRMEAIE